MGAGGGPQDARDNFRQPSKPSYWFLKVLIKYYSTPYDSYWKTNEIIYLLCPYTRIEKLINLLNFYLKQPES